MPQFVPLLIFLALLAALFDVGSMATVFYFLAGILLFVQWWIQRVPTMLSYRRVYDTHVYYGEVTTVTLEINNRSAIAIPWLQFSERLPLRLGYTIPHSAAAYIPGKAVKRLSYTLRGNRRGFYALGPLTLTYGDIFGFEDRIIRDPGTDRLIVYPKIVPLEQLLLPSRTPLGALRSRNPLSEDPSRVIGVRDYRRGDSMRRIHWPASARAGKLQVKKLEPAMTLQTVLLLDLDPAGYEHQLIDHYQELAIVVAASFANRLIDMRQAVGLVSNGTDPLAKEEALAGPALGTQRDDAPVVVPAGRGRGHLIRLLEVLARVESGSAIPFPTLLHQHTTGLGWGTTVVVITGTSNDALSTALLSLRRSGYTVIVVLAQGRRLSVREDSSLEAANVRAYRVRDDVELPAVAEVLRG